MKSDDKFDQVAKKITEGLPEEAKYYERYIKRTKWRVKEDWIFLKQHIKEKHSVLDIGASPPILTGLLKSDGFYKVVATDPSISVFKKFLLEKNIDFYALDVLNQKLPSIVQKPFDLIILAEVIEHLPGNLLIPFGYLKTLLKEEGLLYITTPNLRSLSGFYSIFFKGCGLPSKYNEPLIDQFRRCESDYGYLGHMREYTDREIIQLMTHLGFKHIESKYISRPIDRVKERGMKLMTFAERLTPQSRLFGKHLFQLK